MGRKRIIASLGGHDLVFKGEPDMTQHIGTEDDVRGRDSEKAPSFPDDPRDPRRRTRPRRRDRRHARRMERLGVRHGHVHRRHVQHAGIDDGWHHVHRPPDRLAGTLTFTVAPLLLSPGDTVYAPFAVRLAANTTNPANVVITRRPRRPASSPTSPTRWCRTTAFTCGSGTVDSSALTDHGGNRGDRCCGAEHVRARPGLARDPPARRSSCASR